MKLNKRMKNALLQSMIIQIFLFLIFTMIIVLYIYPNMQQVLADKQMLEDVQQQSKDIQQKGISYGDIKSTAIQSGLMQDSYIQTLLQNTTPEFYATYFTNTSDASYQEFLSTLEEEIQSEKNDITFIEKQQALETILPVYSATSVGTGNTLDDFSFVNYVENILYTFNLTAKGDIGTGNIEKLGNTNKQKNSDATTQSALEEDMYMIPLEFDITGQKKDILDFLHFFENVGKIQISDGDFSVYKDTFIKKPLEGDAYDQDYSIYRHQVAEIQDVSFKEYLDSSPVPEEGDLVTRIQKNQSREKFEISVRIGFYVSGIPLYRMQEFIISVQSAYTELQRDVSQSIAKYTPLVSQSGNGNSLHALQNLQRLEYLLQNMSEDMQNLKKDVAQNTDLDMVYTQTYEISQQLKRIQQQYDESMDILVLEE